MNISECPNPWHQTSEARADQDCPECRGEAIMVEVNVKMTMCANVADWIMAYGTEPTKVTEDMRSWLLCQLYDMTTASDVTGVITATEIP